MTDVLQKSLLSLHNPESIYAGDETTSNKFDNSASKLSSASSTDFARRRPILISSSIAGNKAPCLPKLPDQKIQNRRNLSQSHYIRGSYVNESFFPTQSSALNKRRDEYQNPILVKGDLLKASQILFSLNSNMSESVKHAKSSDTPWNRNPSRFALKPSKSALNKTRIKSAAFMRRSPSPSISNETDRDTFESQPSHVSSSSYRPKSSVSSRLEGRLVSRSVSRIKSAARSIISELERNPIRVEKFAEDLLNKHYQRTLGYPLCDDPVKRIEPDIALHALDTIWELHSYALQNSPFLSQLIEHQLSLPASSPVNVKLQISREKSKTSATQEYLNGLTHILFEIDDPIVDKHALAVALGNLYHPETIEVPGRLAGRVLAIANIMNYSELRDEALDRMSHSLCEKTIGDCYKSAIRYGERRAIELCENWLEMYLVPCLSLSVTLRDIPGDRLQKIIESMRTFTTNEFDMLILVSKWVFLQLNPALGKLPTDEVVITYFSSFAKDKPFTERCPQFSSLFHLIRVYGITNTNSLNTVQHMNIYSQAYLFKIMMEIQHSMTHGGDMLISRQFETSAVRQGFVLDLKEQLYYSEIFSLYGFVFELVAEKSSNDFYKFWIQRLSTDDPAMNYGQNQLETFSMRTERYCVYSINVDFWHNGSRVHVSTGTRKHRFGKAKAKATKTLEVAIPEPNEASDQEIPVEQILVLYSFVFPPD